MHRLLLILSVICMALLGFALHPPYTFIAQARSGSRGAAVPVSFVGCKSEGQGGSLDAPTKAAEVRLDPKIAARLSLYMPENGPVVLGPRGWSCSGWYGSSGVFTVVAPSSEEFATSQGFAGFAIQASLTEGDTSGRFRVAEVTARVFPVHRAFVDRVLAEGLTPASDYVFTPFPSDRLSYRNDRLVEYETAPQSKGLGTYSRLLPNDKPIRGVAILTPESDLRHLAVRLPPDMNNLEAIIVQQFEAGS